MRERCNVGCHGGGRFTMPKYNNCTWVSSSKPNMVEQLGAFVTNYETPIPNLV